MLSHAENVVEWLLWNFSSQRQLRACTVHVTQMLRSGTRLCCYLGSGWCQSARGRKGTQLRVHTAQVSRGVARFVDCPHSHANGPQSVFRLRLSTPGSQRRSAVSGRDVRQGRLCK